jgi:hypothetical protein
MFKDQHAIHHHRAPPTRLANCPLESIHDAGGIRCKSQDLMAAEWGLPSRYWRSSHLTKFEESPNCGILLSTELFRASQEERPESWSDNIGITDLSNPSRSSPLRWHTDRGLSKLAVPSFQGSSHAGIGEERRQLRGPSGPVDHPPH